MSQLGFETENIAYIVSWKVELVSESFFLLFIKKRFKMHHVRVQVSMYFRRQANSPVLKKSVKLFFFKLYFVVGVNIVMV